MNGQTGSGPKSPIRKRGWYLLAALATLALGLASRRYPGLFPAMLGKYPGDALWALMVFFAWGAVLPAASALRLAALALATAFGVEFLKLYQAPWIVSVRHTTLGHLVFGHAFSWQNLVAYTVGVAIGVGVEGVVNTSIPMNELIQQVNERLVHELGRTTAALSVRVQAAQRELASRGALQSGAALIAISRECINAYDEATAAISTELDWAMNQALYLSESFAQKLIQVGHTHLGQITKASEIHFEKICSIAQAGAEVSGSVRMELQTHKEKSEESVRLLVRQRRIEKPRNMLTGALSVLFRFVSKGISSN